MKINLFAKILARGLISDGKILQKELEDLGHEVNWPKLVSHVEKADLNIHLENVYTPHLDSAPINWLMPNPEWFIQELDVLDRIDLVLCKTREAERIFNQLEIKNTFLGFTSKDCFDPTTTKDFNCLFHYQGGVSF